MAFGIVSSAGVFGISLSTLSGLNGNKLHAAKPALIFLGVNALSLAGLNRDVKCSCRPCLHLLALAVQPVCDRPPSEGQTPRRHRAESYRRCERGDDME
jgi:hypothetical protein